MNIGLDLSQNFFDVSPEIVEIDFRVKKGSFMADDECSPQRVSGRVVVDSEMSGKGARSVRTHREFDFFEHLFFALPGEVYERGVTADGDDFCAEFFKFIVLLRQSSEFRCSDEGKVSGIKEQDGPLRGCFLSGKGEFPEIAFGRLKCFQLEIRNTLADAWIAGFASHNFLLLVSYCSQYIIVVRALASTDERYNT
jgi:hypothetical protein